MPKTETESGLPLDNIQIVDFSRLLPGPWCTQFLSDLGADVIKVEMPGTGDMSRHNPPRYEDTSVYFASVNGGKRGITLDLASTEGRGIAHRLIKQADVVVESFRPGVARKLEIDYEAARKLTPDIIYCSITGFGQTGPLSHISGHDLVIQSIAGFMGLGASAGALPQVPGFQAADYAGASVAGLGILAALIRRLRTGEGCNIDLAMYDSLFGMCNIALTGAMAGAVGRDDGTRLEAWGGNPRYAIYGTADGKAVAVALLETRLWAAFCQAVGRPDLIDHDESPDARHSDHGESAEDYRKVISDYCLSRNRDELVDEMVVKGIPISPVYTPEEALASRNVKGRGLIEFTETNGEANIPHIVNPLASSGLATSRREEAPTLGGDGQAIMRELGYSNEEVKNFCKEGVVEP